MRRGHLFPLALFFSTVVLFLEKASLHAEHNATQLHRNWSSHHNSTPLHRNATHWSSNTKAPRCSTPPKGEWKTRQGPRGPPTVPCCSWDEPLKPPCIAYGPYERQNGSLLWHEVPLDTPVIVGSHGCSCPDFASSGDPYTFVSDDLPPWNASLFCDALAYNNGRSSNNGGSMTNNASTTTGRLLMIGDSTMMNCFQALTALLRRDEARCHRDVVLAMSDTMIRADLGLRNQGGYWYDYVREFNPSIVVLNLGAHVRSDMAHRFEGVLRSVVAQHKELFPAIPLIFRTQMPGGCGDFGTEVSNWSTYTRSPTYNFPFLRGFDDIARQHFNSSQDNLFLADISPLYTRADMHPHTVGDCLHSCVLGPLLDIFPRSLLRAIGT